MIDVTAADGKRQRQELVTTHDCTEASAHHIVRERFGSVEATDDTHWKTIIASAPGTETYEGRRAILRHIRVRPRRRQGGELEGRAVRRRQAGLRAAFQDRAGAAPLIRSRPRGRDESRRAARITRY
jgi:hypothetical protein